MAYLTVTDGTKIYYEDYGEGEVILFSHGLNGSHLNFKRIMGEFEDDYRIICYDQRGHESSGKPAKHMNVETLGRDLNDLITSLNLTDINLFGHSMGGATIYSYVNQFSCDKLKRIIVSDMSPYMRNNVWKGGIAQGSWSDDDFMQDMERIFDDVGHAAFHITKNIMNPPQDDEVNEEEMIEFSANRSDALTMASLWFSLFRTDQRPAVDKITVPFLYIKPDFSLYSNVAIDYIRQHVKSDFVLEDNFPDTTHAILNEKPHDVAEKVRKFMKNY